MKKTFEDKLNAIKLLMLNVGVITLHNRVAKQAHANDYPFLEASSSQLGVHMTVHFRMVEDGYGLTFTVATKVGADLSEVKRVTQKLKELHHDIKREKLYFNMSETDLIIKALLNDF